MGPEKINQNVERVYEFVFHTLGCSLEDAKKIFERVLLRYEKIHTDLVKQFKEGLEDLKSGRIKRVV